MDGDEVRLNEDDEIRLKEDDEVRLRGGLRSHVGRRMTRSG